MSKIIFNKNMVFVTKSNSPFYSCVLGYQAFEQEWG